MFKMPRSEFQPIRDVMPTDRQSLKIDRARAALAIRIRNIDMASERLVDDYPDLAGWYCLAVKFGCEFSVEKHLKKNGVKATVPRCQGVRRERRHGGQRYISLPVIRGYVLVRCVYSPMAFAGLRSVDDVLGVLGGWEMPHKISDKSISEFINLADEGEFDPKPLKPIYLDWNVGDLMRIKSGPFADFEAVIVDMIIENEGARIGVDIQIFGRASRIELPVATLEKV